MTELELTYGNDSDILVKSQSCRRGGDLSESYEKCQRDAHISGRRLCHLSLSLARMGVFVNIVVCVEDGAGEGEQKLDT